MSPTRVILAVSGLLLAASPALAQKTVPGEKWRSSFSMEAAGMKLPGRTQEICVPIGQAEEALARPPDQENCEMYDVKRAGNKFSAKMRCTGKTPMEGTIEAEGNATKSSGRMTMSMEGMTMSMNYSGEKLGQACEAKDYSNYKPPVVAAPQGPDVCGMTAQKLTPAQLSSVAPMYVGQSAACTKHASYKTFCSAVQSHAGFVGLSAQERSMGRFASNEADPLTTNPLTTSVEGCGIGKGKAGVDGLRTRLLGSAEKEGAWDFMVMEGNDATWQTLVATGKRECSGRSFTSAGNPRYANLCRKYGLALSRNDRNAALNAAGVSGDDAGVSSGSPAATAPGSSAEADAVAAEQRAARQGSAATEQPAPTAEEQQKSKARDAVDKGKKVLRGIFGGGN